MDAGRNRHIAALAAAGLAALAGLAGAAEASAALRRGPIAARPAIQAASARLATPAGRLAVDVRVRFGDVRPARARLLADEATLTGHLTVRLRGANGRTASAAGAEILPPSVRGSGSVRTLRAWLTRGDTRRLLMRGSARTLRAAVSVSERLDEWGDGRDDYGASDAARMSVPVARLGTSDPGLGRCDGYISPQSGTTEGGRLFEIEVAPNQARPEVVELCSGPSLKLDSFRIESERRPADHTIRLQRIPIGIRPRATVAFRLQATFTPRKGFAGLDGFTVTERRPDGKTGDSFRVAVRVKPFLMRALGDSVTAGFGYFDDGDSMVPPDLFKTLPGEQRFDLPILLGCKPLDTPLPNNRCSSNSPDRTGYDGTAVHYSADYGYANQVSWAAQLAKKLGIRATETASERTYRTYANYAVTGSEPRQWAGGASFSNGKTGELSLVRLDNPDLTVMTLGANPLLSELLVDLGNQWRCANEARNGGTKGLTKCVSAFIAQEKVRERMASVFRQLMLAPDNHVLVMGYPTVWPAISFFSPDGIRVLVRLINTEIAAAVGDVRAEGAAQGWGDRLHMVAPPPFYFGGPGGNCDGPSRQSRISQDLFSTLGTLNFLKCPSSNYWVISGDLGIHPSKAGYAGMAETAEDAVRDLKLPVPK
ncbi:MAG: hypothetical protein U0R70_15910 [Solirubrobacteraceae bacterium]